MYGPEFDRRALELLLGLLPGTADSGDLGTVDPAHPGETGERLAVAVLLGRLDPLARTPVVGHVPAGPDHPAGGHPGQHGRQLPVDRRDGGLFHHREPVEGGSGGDLQRAEIGQCARLEVGVSRVGPDRDGAFGERECLVDIARGRGALAHAQRQISVGVGLAIRTDDADRHGAPRRAAIDVLPWIAVGPRDVDRQVRRADVVALGQVCLERTLLHVKRDIGMCVEEGGECERLEVGARQLAIAIGDRQLLECLGPDVARERDPTRFEWIRTRRLGRWCRRLAHRRPLCTRDAVGAEGTARWLRACLGRLWRRDPATDGSLRP